MVGHGGVGKSTTAVELAIGAAKRGEKVHLISVDPAHSLRDVIGDEDLSAGLTVEEFDAESFTARWLAEVRCRPAHARPARDTARAG